MKRNIDHVFPVVPDLRWDFHTSQADGDITLTLPLIPTLKSDHFLTFPSPRWHDFDMLAISFGERTRFQIFKPVSSPM